MASTDIIKTEYHGKTTLTFNSDLPAPVSDLPDLLAPAPDLPDLTAP